MFGKHPNDIIAYLYAIWKLPYDVYPYELKRIKMDDLLNEQSPEMRKAVKSCLDFEIRKLHYKLIVLKTLLTDVEETEEILKELSEDAPSLQTPVHQSSSIVQDCMTVSKSL